MRRYIIICFITIMVFSDCKKVLNEPDYGISQINTREDMNEAMNGLYARLALYMNDNFTLPQYLADDLGISWHTSFQPLTYSGYSYAEYNNNKGRYTIDFGQTNWQRLYDVIASANNVISQFKNSTNIKNDLKSGLGEAYLLRAYSYYRLARIFGQVPIVDNTEVNFLMQVSTFKDIYAFIESDLMKAANYLPVTKSSARIPYQSPVRGSAKAMLAEVYLTMGGYPLKDAAGYMKAAEVAKEVMDSANIFGFNLLPDYANLWDGSNKFNNEALFGLYFTNKGLIRHYKKINYPSGGSFISISGKLNPEINNAYIWDPWWDSTSYSSRIITGAVFFNNYPESYRKDVTFQNVVESGTDSIIYLTPDSSIIEKLAGFTKCRKISTIYTAYSINHSPSVYYKKFGFTINIDTLFKFSRYYTKRWYRYSYDSTVTDIKKYVHVDVGQPIYIYRYAHVLLAYAEAKARSGLLDAFAYEAVNKIRRRANKEDINTPSKYDLQPGLSAQAFADSVVLERGWEFCAEPEGRWYDLLRLEMIEQLPKLRGEGPEMTKSDYFDIIPRGDKLLNPNLK